MGDYIGENYQQDVLHGLITERLVRVRELTYRHSSQLHIVYINNLTDAMVRDLHEGLRSFVPYVGFADTTYASPFKSYLSTILPHCYIQHRNTNISGHEDDRPDAEDVNLAGFPFEETGYKIRSLPGNIQRALLSYKIERPVWSRFEADFEFSLNAVHPNPLPLRELVIEIDQRKFNYLASEKAESLRNIGLLDGDAASLKEMIKQKIASNYIYSMTYTEAHDTVQFNIIMEVQRPNTKPFRVLVALKYVADSGRLQLITLF